MKRDAPRRFSPKVAKTSVRFSDRPLNSWSSGTDCTLAGMWHFTTHRKRSPIRRPLRGWDPVPFPGRIDLCVEGVSNLASPVVCPCQAAGMTRRICRAHSWSWLPTGAAPIDATEQLPHLWGTSQRGVLGLRVAPDPGFYRVNLPPDFRGYPGPGYGIPIWNI